MPWAAELTLANPRLPLIDVIVGILVDQHRRVLVARRPAGKHMAGAWEFPGGKLEPGEAPLDGLRRELAEELGISVAAAEPLIRHRHSYPDRTVALDVWWVAHYAGSARALEGQVLRWVDSAALGSLDLLPADAPIVAAVRERLD